MRADGSGMEFIPGGPADPVVVGQGHKRDLKDYQTKDAMWAERLLRSEAAIDNVAGIDDQGKPAVVTGPDGKERRAYNPARAANNWFPDEGILASTFNSGDWKTYQQAARESIAAILRKDTGAAVTETEWNLYFPMLFPQPNDPPQVVMQKKQSREAAARALQAASGPAWNVMYPDGVPGANPNKTGGQPLPKGPPPDAIRDLLADPSPEAVREFEEVFRVPAAQFLTRS
jgi:hypothetical protein